MLLSPERSPLWVMLQVAGSCDLQGWP